MARCYNNLSKPGDRQRRDRLGLGDYDGIAFSFYALCLLPPYLQAAAQPMLRFADRTALSDYLMGKYDTSWGQDMASPFIMENDEFMDGWRPNPDRKSSAIG